MGKGRLVAVVVVLAAATALTGCSKPPAAAPPPASAPPAIVTPEVQTVEEAQTLERAGRSDEYERALDTLDDATDPGTRRRALALRGLHLFEQKRYAEAVPVLTEAAAAYPEVAPFLRLRIVDAEIGREELQRAAAVASEIIALGETSAATVARLRLPEIYARAGDNTAADAAFRQAMQVPVDELTEPDFIAMGNALAEAGRNDLATQVRMRLLRDYTSGRYTEQLYGQLKQTIAALPVEEKLALATKLSRANRYDQALDLFAQIPGTAVEARSARLRALFNSRNYGQLLEETKDVNLGSASLALLRARAAWRNDRPQEFLAGLEQVEKQYPKSREAAAAKVLRAKYYVTDEIDYAKSVENLEKAIEAGAVGNDGENIWNLGWTYTLWGRYEDALKVFDRYIRAYPDGDWKTNSLFWSAKIHDRLGRTAQRDASARQVVAEYPFSYYSYRSKELWPSVADQPAASNAKFPDLERALAAVDEPRLTTVNELLEIEMRRAAAREMKVLAARHADNPGVQFMLADVYVRAGETFKANGVLQRQFRQFVRHGGDEIPQRFWEILFPLAWWDTIQREAQRRGLDPYLVASIIRQESLFEPTIVSNAGAVGLMQIMPQEASRIARAGGLSDVTRQDLFEPETNIAVGAAEYAQKLALMNGRHILAIASYNAGERAVGTWLEKTPIDDIDLFIESIPYAETRLYVKIVTRNRFEYRRIYERNNDLHQPATSSP